MASGRQREMTRTSQSGALTKLGLLALLVVAVAGLPGCASAPKDSAAKAQYERDNDPIEPFNRAMFAFNKQMDGMFLRPAAVMAERLGLLEPRPQTLALPPEMIPQP